MSIPPFWRIFLGIDLALYALYMLIRKRRHMGYNGALDVSPTSSPFLYWFYIAGTLLFSAAMIFNWLGF